MSDTKPFRIAVTANGPYLVSGGVPLAKQHVVTNAEGESLDYRQGQSFGAEAKYALCRCGQSARKPFCDGTHQRVGFDGTETASRASQREQAEVTVGPGLTLLDADPLCAFGRFCDTHGKIWNLIEKTDDPAVRQIVETQAAHCPAGRLVVLDTQSGQAVEPQLPPSIGLFEDTAKQVSGPLFVRGGIPVTAADGTVYEVRNRQALCRCGASSNKPFCDGSHATVGFRDDI